MQVTRTHSGTKELCKECNSKKYRAFVGYPKSEYGCIVIHKEMCPYIRKMINRLKLKKD